jgi:hypothetical protein
MSTGLEDDAPVALDGRLLEAEKRLSFEFRIWSRSFRSSLADIISAAAPLGQRMIGMTPGAISNAQSSGRCVCTHCDHNTEQSTNDSVYYVVQFLILRSSTIQSPVSVLLSHSQAKQVWLSNNEIKVLIVELRNALRGV